MSKRFKFPKGCETVRFPILGELMVYPNKYTNAIKSIRDKKGYSKKSYAKYVLTIYENGNTQAEIIISQV